MRDEERPGSGAAAVPETRTTPARGRRLALLAILAVILVAAALGWRSYHAATASSSPGSAGAKGWTGSPSQPVAVALVQRRDLPVTVDAIGSVAAANTAVVRAKVSGELQAIRFAEGKPVRAGQLLAQIDPRPYAIAVAQAEGQLARDEAQLANARIDLDRYRDLVARDAAPQQQLATQQALVGQLQGTVATDRAGVDSARLQLSYTRVLAPIGGLAGLKQADLGNVVGPADANGLVSIAQTRPAAVLFAVPDVNVVAVRGALGAGKPLDVEAWDRAHTTLLAKGRVASSDNTIDPTTGTLRLKALFANTDDQLFPSQFVNVRLQLDTLRAATVLPTAALQRGAPGTFVYSVAGDGTVSLVKVTVLASNGDQIAVQAPLRVGDRVVIDGADRLRDGAKVEVIPPTGAASAAAPAGGGQARWMDHLPPAVVAKLKAMSEDERRAWIREQRAKRAASAASQSGN